MTVVNPAEEEIHSVMDVLHSHPEECEYFYADLAATQAMYEGGRVEPHTRAELDNGRDMEIEKEFALPFGLRRFGPGRPTEYRKRMYDLLEDLPDPDTGAVLVSGKFPANIRLHCNRDEPLYTEDITPFLPMVMDTYMSARQEGYRGWAKIEASTGDFLDVKDDPRTGDRKISFDPDGWFADLVDEHVDDDGYEPLNPFEPEVVDRVVELIAKNDFSPEKATEVIFADEDREKTEKRMEMMEELGFDPRELQ